MSPNEAQEVFLRESDVAVLATVDRRGRAHAAPIWYLYEDGEFVMSTGRGSQKHRNIEANPDVTLVIDRRSLPYYYLSARGGAEVGRALEKQHRRIDAPEMRVADALRLAGWVKGVAEKGESGGGRTVGHDMRGDAAAHRFAAEEWLRELCRYRLGYGAVTGLEPRLRVG